MYGLHIEYMVTAFHKQKEKSGQRTEVRTLPSISWIA